MRFLLALLVCAAMGVGDTVPDLALTDLQGRSLSLSQLRKHASSGLTCLVFWCSTCDSCRRVEGSIEELSHELQGKVAVVGVVASAGETSEKIHRFQERAHLSFPIFFDPGGKLADLFEVKVTTTTIVLDGQGKVRYFGQFKSVKGELYAAQALHDLLGGRPVHRPATHPFG